MLKTSGLRFLAAGYVFGSLLSTMANLMSGFFLAAARVSSLSRKPTVTMMLQLASTIDWMFLAKSAAVWDSTSPVSMPNSVLASVRPLYEVWLNDLSSKPPESETMQALKPPPPHALALVLPLGAADGVLVPGAWAQADRVRAAAPISAPARVIDLFTNCLLGKIHKYLSPRPPFSRHFALLRTCSEL